MSRPANTLDYRPAEPPAREAAGAPPLLLGVLAAILAGGTIALLAGVNTINVIATFIADGLVPLMDLVAATFAGMAIARRIGPGARASLLIASGAGVGLGLLITAGLLLGLAGLLNAWTAWLVVGVLALGAIDIYPFASAQLRLRQSARRAARVDQPPAAFSLRLPLSALACWFLLLAAVPLGVAIAGATLPPGILWGDEPHGYDVLSYHLQVPREWYEAGRIIPVEHNVFSHFPLGQETVSLVLMHQMGGPWNAMFAAQITSLLLMVLATVAVYGAVEQFAIRTTPQPEHVAGLLTPEPVAPDAPILAAIIFAVMPWAAMLGSIAYNEALLLLAGALACAWLLRAIEGDWRAGLLAGLFAGLGVAAKYPAVPMLCIGGAVALGVALPWRTSSKQAAMTLAAFVAGALVFSLPWLIRNIAWTGNPVFPLATGVFGDGGWGAELVERWNRAHTLAADETRLGRFVEDLLLNPRYAFAFWPLVIAAGGLLVARRDRRAVMLAMWMAIMLAIWLFATHLQGRFLVVAAPVGAILIGLAIAPRLRVPGLAITIIIAAASMAFLLPAAHRRMAAGRSADLSIFGFRDLDQLTALEDAARARGLDVYLVGDARAFLYPVDRLHYKVVFNVPPAQGALRAWLGESLETAPADSLVVIDPAEVDRLNRTYGTPPLEAPLMGSGLYTMRQVRRMLESAEAKE